MKNPFEDFTYLLYKVPRDEPEKKVLLGPFSSIDRALDDIYRHQDEWLARGSPVIQELLQAAGYHHWRGHREWRVVAPPWEDETMPVAWRRYYYLIVRLAVDGYTSLK